MTAKDSALEVSTFTASARITLQVISIIIIIIIKRQFRFSIANTTSLNE